MDKNAGDIIGYISEAEGMVLVTNEEGEIRNAYVGDPLYLNETIINQSEANVTIELINNQMFYLVNNQRVVLGPSLLTDHSSELPTSEIETASDQSKPVPDVSNRENSEPQARKESTSPDNNKPAEDTYIKEVVINYDGLNHESQPGNSSQSAIATGPENHIPEITEAPEATIALNQTIKILDQSFAINENSLADGSLIVGTVFAKDPEGASIIYRIISGNEDEKFEIDPATGALSLVGDLNYEDRPDYNLVIEVEDSGTLKETASIAISVNEINEIPVAVNDSEDITENELLTINVLANDQDVDFTDTPDNFSLDEAYITDHSGSPITGFGSVSIQNNQLAFDPGSDFDYLTTGEITSIEIYYQMSDNGGLQSEAAVTLNITGTNDAPIVEAETKVYSTLEELFDDIAGELTSTLSDNGSFTIADVELSDTQSVTFASASSEYLGSFSVTVGDNTTGDGSGRIDWDFEVSDSDIDYLAAGQTLTQTYTVTVSDGEGSEVDQDIVITLTGTNDVPIIEATTNVIGDITEMGDNDVGELTST
ncbi:VCBS domain-containing protein, partial [Endozoicomonas ascidiicola]